MQTKFILPCLLSTLFFLNSFSPSAQNRKTIETTTDILMFITPVAGFAGSLAIGDYQGTKQIIFSGAMNMAMTYAHHRFLRQAHFAFPSRCNFSDPALFFSASPVQPAAPGLTQCRGHPLSAAFFLTGFQEKLYHNNFCGTSPAP